MDSLIQVSPLPTPWNVELILFFDGNSTCATVKTWYTYNIYIYILYVYIYIHIIYNILIIYIIIIIYICKYTYYNHIYIHILYVNIHMIITYIQLYIMVIPPLLGVLLFATTVPCWKGCMTIPQCIQPTVWPTVPVPPSKSGQEMERTVAAPDISWFTGGNLAGKIR